MNYIEIIVCTVIVALTALFSVKCASNVVDVISPDASAIIDVASFDDLHGIVDFEFD